DFHGSNKGNPSGNPNNPTHSRSTKTLSKKQGFAGLYTQHGHKLRFLDVILSVAKNLKAP
ncbi:MAG: hypothetical protein KAR36_01420, partial [Candidatus Latescibacteria bacterium]|nr:hypothetical protein [Candidatus Latescibacterota bacterium]